MFQIANFSNFLNQKFLEFPKFEIFGIVQINKFLDFFQFGKLKFSNFGIFRPFDISYYQQFCLFRYMLIVINQLSQFLFPILVTPEFEIRNVSYSKILLFEICTLIPKINYSYFSFFDFIGTILNMLRNLFCIIIILKS